MEFHIVFNSIRILIHLSLVKFDLQKYNKIYKNYITKVGEIYSQRCFLRLFLVLQNKLTYNYLCAWFFFRVTLLVSIVLGVDLLAHDTYRKGILRQ
jgi:hypothetical protein